MFGGDISATATPTTTRRSSSSNELIANCVIYQTALDITGVVNQLVAEGPVVDPDNLATISPYIRENIRRFGECVLDTTTPEPAVTTRLDIVLDS